MQFDFDKCRELLSRSLIDAIAEHGSLIRDLDSKHRKTLFHGVSAMSYDILPWEEPYLTLSFRTSVDDLSGRSIGHSPPRLDWLPNWIGSHNAESGAETRVADYIHDASEIAAVCRIGGCEFGDQSPDLPGCRTDALLEPRVATVLSSWDVPAKMVSRDRILTELGWFEFVVVDYDKHFKANYCELVFAAGRLNRRVAWARRVNPGSLAVESQPWRAESPFF